jgi:effector-binding domain-containing protein
LSLNRVDSGRPREERRSAMTIPDPRLVETEPMTVACLAVEGAYDQLPASFGRLYEWLTSQGLVPAGMPRAVFLTDPSTLPTAQARWELRAPIEAGPAARGPDGQGLGVRHVPARTLATIIHKGPYDDAEKTYAHLTAWIARRGYRIVGPPEEAYLTDPADVPPEEYLTEISIPVAPAG